MSGRWTQCEGNVLIYLYIWKSPPRIPLFKSMSQIYFLNFNLKYLLVVISFVLAGCRGIVSYLSLWRRSSINPKFFWHKDLRSYKLGFGLRVRFCLLQIHIYLRWDNTTVTRHSKHWNDVLATNSYLMASKIFFSSSYSLNKMQWFYGRGGIGGKCLQPCVTSFLYTKARDDVIFN